MTLHNLEWVWAVVCTAIAALAIAIATQAWVRKIAIYVYRSLILGIDGL
jgi:hypothetical protein